MFLLIAEAYEILSDELKRQKYDEYGTRSTVMGGTTSKGPQRASTDESYDSEELYEKIYRCRPGSKNFEDEMHYNPSLESSRLDSTYEFKVDLSFEEAAL
ncbi:DnaJ-like protein subfamily A member 3, partial [Caligus rogercresseyi]